MEVQEKFAIARTRSPTRETRVLPREKPGEVQTIMLGEDSAEPAVGIIPRAHFKTTEPKLAPGDCLLFFTDGIIEVEARDGSQFGVEGLRQSVRSNLDQPTESLLDAIISDVYVFGDSTALTDDACLVADTTLSETIFSVFAGQVVSNACAHIIAPPLQCCSKPWLVASRPVRNP